MYHAISKRLQLILSIALAASILTITAIPLRLNITRAQIEIAWDIHGVLVKQHTAGMINVLVAKNGKKTFPLMCRLGYNYVRYAFTGKMGASQKMVCEIRQLIKKGAVGEEYKQIIEKYDPELWVIAEQMAAQHRPIKGMQALVQELDALNYIQRVASNIGTHEFVNLKNKWPDYFGYFKDGKTVDYLGEGIAAIQKPSAQYFTDYQKKYNPDGTKIIIFIDDKCENVLAARRAGMIAIHFKNAKQLRKDLKKLGIALT